MNIQLHPIKFANQKFLLTNERVLYWESEKALILSDVHLGKAAHFRRHGIPIPSSVQIQDLNRLEDLLLYFCPEKVFIVGDLVHANSSAEVLAFAELTRKFASISFILIEGNHDRLSLEFWRELGIPSVFKSIFIKGICLIHKPINREEIPTICGHIHPGIRIILPNKKGLKLPCFVQTKNQLILPAFSLFTGLDTSTASENSIFYGFDKDGIYVF